MRFSTPTTTLLTTLLSASTVLGSAIPLRPRSDNPDSPTPRHIYSFPNETWLENIAARSNGDLLVTQVDRPELDAVHPFTSPEATSSVVHVFEGYTGVLGITELKHDVFAVAVGNYTHAAGGVKGTFGVWTVDFNCPNGTRVSHVADVPEAANLNGAAAVNDHIVLLSDSATGTVIKVDTIKNTSEVVIQNDWTAVNETAVLTTIGVNGLKVLDDYLYFTNFGRNSFNRVKIDSEGRPNNATFEKIAYTPLPDDFAITDDGTAYVSESINNIVSRITPDGQRTVLAGNLNSTVIADTTSAALGRTYKDRGVVYFATAGGIPSPINGTFIEGGKVVAIDL